MRKLWKMAQDLKPGKEQYEQEVLYLKLRALLFGAAGALAWFFVRLFILDSLEWLICFVGYPAIFGVLGGLLFLYQGKHVNESNQDTKETE